MQNMLDIAKQAKAASVVLAQLGNVQKNQALLTIAEQLEARQAEILAANAKDIEFAQSQGISPAIIDRLLLTEIRLQGIAIKFRLKNSARACAIRRGANDL